MYRIYRSLLLLVSLLAFPALAQPPFVGAFGYTGPNLTPVAPGQVLTLYAQGIKAQLNKPVVASGLPLPTILAGISVLLRQSPDGYANAIPVPLLSVARTPDCSGSNDLANRYYPGCGVQVTIQIPYELLPSCPDCGSIQTASIRAALSVSEDGVEGTPIPVLPLPTQIHAVDPCDVMFSEGSGAPSGFSCGPAVTHADGTPVSQQNPARQGETVTMYVLGLWYTNPAEKTGERSPRVDIPTMGLRLGAVFGSNPNANPVVYFTGDFLPGQLPVEITYAGLVEGYVGLYQVNFIVPNLPADAPSCGRTNVTLSLGTRYGDYSGGGICVAR